MRQSGTPLMERVNPEPRNRRYHSGRASAENTRAAHITTLTRTIDPGSNDEVWAELQAEALRSDWRLVVAHGDALNAAISASDDSDALLDLMPRVDLHSRRVTAFNARVRAYIERFKRAPDLHTS
jgi:hypothetical protein